MADLTLTDGTPSTATLLTTLARARLNTALSELSDADLTEWLKAATALLCRWCGRTLYRHTIAAEVHDGDDSDELQLREFPLQSLTSVTIADEDESTTEIAGSEFRTDLRTALIKFKPSSTAEYSTFPAGFQNVSVAYIAGYDPVPDDIQEACIELAAWLRQENDRDLTAVQERLGEYSRTHDALQRAPASVQSVVQSYRDVRVT